MSNCLDPDQDRHYVGPDLGPNCLRWLSADCLWRQRVKALTRKKNLIYVFCFSRLLHIFADIIEYLGMETNSVDPDLAVPI